MFSQLSFPDLLVRHLQLIAKIKAFLNVGCFVYVLCGAGYDHVIVCFVLCSSFSMNRWLKNISVVMTEYYLFLISLSVPTTNVFT